jgi:predicted membrane metal-binding protein
MGSTSKSDQAIAKEHRLSAIATDALKDLATLFQTELQLLRTEISEKLTLSGLSVALIAAGALMLAATIVLLLQAAIAALVAFNFSLTMAILIVATMTLIVGAALVWVGIKGLGFSDLVPKKTIKQLNKDANLAHIGES